MISVVGLELFEAQRRLQSVGVSVLLEHCSSKKGVANSDSKRVIRQKINGDSVILTFSDFQTCPIAMDNGEL